MNIVSFTPVRQTPAVLKEFLRRLDQQGLADQWFYDDNTDPESSTLLEDRNVLPPIDLPPSTYERGDITHLWEETTVSRVAEMKNYAIDWFNRMEFEAILFVDSDVLLLPDTVAHLDNHGEDVVSSVYWSKWKPTDPWMPNVWEFNSYGFSSPDSLFQLRDPGLHMVGGLGACTLIDGAVLARPQVRFTPVPNWRVWGEDRWFCMRCAVMDIDLMACTCMTPWHVYRESDLIQGLMWTEKEATKWKAKNLGDSWVRAVEGSAGI